MADCPIRWGADKSICDLIPSVHGGTGFDCERCGQFDVSGSALASQPFTTKHARSARWRAALSHLVRASAEDRPHIKSDALQEGLTYRLPSPAVQAVNLIRTIGDHQLENGQDWPFDKSAPARMGALTEEHAYRIVNELMQAGLIAPQSKVEIPKRAGGVLSTSAFDLTLAGWDRYEANKHSGAPASTGFWR